MSPKDDEGQERVASGYLPMECPVCDRVRLEYFIDSHRNLDIKCEKCYSDKESLIEAFETDHRDAQQLREQVEMWRGLTREAQANRDEAWERVRVLEEALREEAKCKGGCINGRHFDNVARRWYDCGACKGTGLTPKAAALLSPAAATEGGEGA